MAKKPVDPGSSSDARTSRRKGTPAGRSKGEPAGPRKDEPAVGRPRIAIACQGGGSQTAFTAGALRGLFEAGVQRDFEIVSLSGTSGGAICATLAWYSLMKGEPEPWQRLYAFWRENAARTPEELALNQYLVESMRMTNAGRLMSLAFSPSSPMVQMMMAFSTRRLRPLFTDFRGLIEKHVDFAELASWGPSAKAPVLLMGAVDVLSGRLATFCSSLEPIRVEHLLATCAVPNIFPAVEFDGGAYWDGLFSDNPPISELAQSRFVGAANVPQEIWVIKINATTSRHVPSIPGDITDRRNALIGNMSLFQQIESLSVLNDLYIRGAFRPGFAESLDLDGPIRIPRCFNNDEPRSYHLPFLEMSAELSDRLDYESKLDRSATLIEALMVDGEQQARAFLAQRAALGQQPAYAGTREQLQDAVVGLPPVGDAGSSRS